MYLFKYIYLQSIHIYDIIFIILCIEVRIIIKDELKYSTIYDHYKETVAYLKKDLEKRDKITLYILVLFSIYFIVEFKPSDSVMVANTFIKNKAGFLLNLNYDILSTLVLVLILGTIIKYFQMCLNIEKQYDYIHNLEDKLNALSDEKLITREGYSYLKEYPLLSALIHRIYTFFLPLLIIVAMIIKTYMIIKTGLSILTVINITIGFLIILCTILYWLFIYRANKFIECINNKFKSLFVILHLYNKNKGEVLMAKKKVCVSFDYENDKHYRYLLSAWDANSDFEFSFNDRTPSEINSNDYSRVKAVITQKIDSANYLLVIVGKHANDIHPRKEEIGDINWLNWEVNKAKKLGKKLVAVKIDRSYDSPTALLSSGASWAMSFTQDSIIKALDEA